MATENMKADPTYIGFFLIGIFLLIFGIFGLQSGGLFGDVFPTEETVYNKVNLPLSESLIMTISLIMALAMLVIAILSWKAGNKSSMAVFGVLAFIFMILSRSGLIKIMEENVEPYRTSYAWFVPVILAVVLIILTLYLLIEGQSKLTALLCVFIAAAMVLYGVQYFTLGTLEWSDIGESVWVVSSDLMPTKIVGIIYGIISIAGFVIATYLGYAYALPKKLPVI